MDFEPRQRRPLTLSVSTGIPTITVSNTDYVGLVLAGSQGLALAGSGTLVLTNANTFTGGTVINGGTLMVSNLTALGSSPSKSTPMPPWI